MNKNFLKTLFVKENATVKQVLNKLQKLKIKNQKFCLVSNSKNKIIDVLTDGDIRRILLKTDKLDAQIKHFLKKKFFYSREKNLTKNKKFLKLKKIKFLPILNQDNSLKDIIFLDNINDNIENEIFIFAGGRGKRMFPLTENLPKPMMNIGGLPLIESMINNFRSQGFKNFVISVNYLSNIIKNYFKKREYFDEISFIEEKKQLGTAGSLALLKTKIEKPIICMNGDIYTNLNFKLLLDHHVRSKNVCTICTRDFKTKIPYGVIEKGKSIINEKPIISKKISTGIYVFNKNMLKLIKKNKFLDMNDFINELYKKNKKIGFFHIYELLYDIGDIKTYEDVNNYLNKQ